MKKSLIVCTILLPLVARLKPPYAKAATAASLPPPLAKFLSPVDNTFPAAAFSLPRQPRLLNNLFASIAMTPVPAAAMGLSNTAFIPGLTILSQILELRNLSAKSSISDAAYNKSYCSSINFGPNLDIIPSIFAPRESAAAYNCPSINACNRSEPAN